MHSVFALEAAANCCVAQLPRNHRFRKQAEKWNSLDKFDLYLLAFPGSPGLPRDHALVEAAAELIGIRHAYVHSRTQNHQVHAPTNAGPQIRLVIEASKHNGIPEMTMTWNDSHAKTALRSVINFLKFYFRDLCKLDQAGVKVVLCSLIKSQQGYRVVDGGNRHKILGLAKGLNVDLTFLGLDQ